MTPFPIIDPFIRAYRFMWDSHRLWLQYALLTIFIKGGAAALILLLDFQDSPMRAALLSLPAFFAEGLLVAFVIKLALLKMPRQGDFLAVFSKRDLQAAMIIYVLIQLTFSLISMLIMSEPLASIIDTWQAGQNGDTPASFTRFGLSVLALATIIWAFRFIWLYVPYAMGVSARRYVRTFKPYAVSFNMIGLAFLCMVPIGFIVLVLAQIIIPAGVETAADMTQMQSLALVLMQAPLTVALVMVTGVAMAYAMAPALTGQKDQT